MNKIVKLLLLTSCITSVTSSFALPDDSQKVIDIEADSAFIDNEKGNAIYIGNVKVTQGSILISANKLTITSSNTSKKYDKIYAKGTDEKIANFSQQLDLNGDIIISRGTKIFYDSTSSILEVEGHGYIKRGEDEITADFIRYDMTSGTFEAKKEKSGRVSMTLQPQQDTTKAE